MKKFLFPTLIEGSDSKVSVPEVPNSQAIPFVWAILLLSDATPDLGASDASHFKLSILWLLRPDAQMRLENRT
jgi:hypothetical protein